MVEIFYILDGEVTFAFEDQSIVATTRTTITVPADTRHEVTTADGARVVTIFTPGEFDRCLSELVALSPAELDDPDRIREPSELYDIWPE